MGLLSYPPNNDGIRYYLDEIHPLVKRKQTDVTITVIGKDPPNWLYEKAEKDKSIHVKGYVQDVDPELEQAAICICPIRYGSGTRLKILEYMAAGKPVISTTTGAEGIEAKSDKEIIIADSAHDFAENIINLFRNREKALKLGISARNLTEKNYNWQTITEKLSKFYQEKVKDHENTHSK